MGPFFFFPRKGPFPSFSSRACRCPTSHIRLSPPIRLGSHLIRRLRNVCPPFLFSSGHPLSLFLFCRRADVLGPAVSLFLVFYVRPKRICALSRTIDLAVPLSNGRNFFLPPPIPQRSLQEAFSPSFSSFLPFCVRTPKVNERPPENLGASFFSPYQPFSSSSDVAEECCRFLYPTFYMAKKTYSLSRNSLSVRRPLTLFFNMVEIP